MPKNVVAFGQLGEALDANILISHFAHSLGSGVYEWMNDKWDLLFLEHSSNSLIYDSLPL